MYLLSHSELESHWSPRYRYVVFFVPLMRSEKPDCELKVRVLSGDTMNGCDQGPLRESARKATTSMKVKVSSGVREKEKRSSGVSSLGRLTVGPVAGLVAHKRKVTGVRLNNGRRLEIILVKSMNHLIQRSDVLVVFRKIHVPCFLAVAV